MTTTSKLDTTVECTTCRTCFDAEMNYPAPVGTGCISLKPCPNCGGTNREVVECAHDSQGVPA